MAFEVVWSLSSEKEFIKTLNYWSEKNQSKTYSLKLYSEIFKLITILKEYPNLGIKTNYKNNRIVITSNYKFIYEATKTQIKIKRFFDTRRNPQSILKFNK